MAGSGFSLVVAPYGRPATTALREEIASAKGGDPLAPVTVVVPSNFAGLTARRLLASGEVGTMAGLGPGLANVRFVTIYALAQHLGAPLLARRGRVPLSTPVLVATIRQVLSEDPGIFGPVAGHPATERALADAFAELSHVSELTLALLSDQSERAREVVRIYRAVRRRVESHHDEFDLVAAATEEAREGLVLAGLGPVVLHLPQRLTRPAVDLLAALATRLPVTVVAGLTGNTTADEPILTTLEGLGLSVDASVETRAPPGSRVVEVADPDEEVRAVVRRLAEAVDAGEPLNRMAVVYPVRQPYLLALHEQLAAAGIPFNGPSSRTLADTAAGRTMLGLLALADRGFRRDDLIAWVGSSPVRGADGRFVPATRWDRLSRQAGVVDGASSWDQHLSALARNSELAASHQRADGEPDERVAATERRTAEVRELRSFVLDLAERTLDGSPARSSAPWSDWASWLHGLMGHYLGDVRLSSRWPADEVVDHQRVEAALDRLRGLDEVDGETSLAGFGQMLETELAGPSSRHGRFGEGVLLVSMHTAVGLDLDEVFVLGLAEGTLPGHHRDDSLLPDHERVAAGHDLPTRDDRTADEHRFLLASLAAAPRAMVTVPRGDPRRGRTRLRSRWVPDADNGELEVVDSFTAGLRSARIAASAADFDLRTLLLASDAGTNPLHHELVRAIPDLVAGFDLIEGRASERFTRYDGNLTSVVGGVVDLSGRVVSPTSLQNWATCPRQYFLSHVLRLGEVERPEAVLRLSHLDRGTLVHEILERFIGERLDVGRLPRPTEPWSDDDRRRVHVLADEVFARFERTGITGKAVNWAHDKEVLKSDLDRALDLDDERRAELDVTPAAIEMPFGLDGATPVELTLPSGRSVSFRGRADRVDRGDDGRLAVIDYKTGGATRQSVLNDDPVDAGRMLQLPLYGLAARQQHGDPDTPVAAHYWYVSTKGNFDIAGYELNRARESRFVEVIETISQGLADGVFPAYPGEYDTWRGTNDNCVWCTFDRLCPTSRLDEWERIEGDEAIEPFLALELDQEETA